MSFLDVTGSGANARFQIRFHGAMIAKVYGSLDCRGRYLDEIVPAERRAAALAPYRETLQRGCPVYTIHDLTDRDGRLIYFERLLLPFSRDGEDVDRILASFEFICADGAFDSDSLLITPAAPMALRLSAVIEPRALA